MPLATLTREVSDATKAKVRQRYGADIQRLSALGFREYCFYTELLRPYSLILNFPIVVMMKMQREVVSRYPRLRAGGSYLLLRHDSPPTMALPFGMGVKLYTGFNERFTLITANFKSLAIPDNNPLIQKHGDVVPLYEAWQLHQRRTQDNINLGRTFQDATYELFVQMSEQEENAMRSRP